MRRTKYQGNIQLFADGQKVVDRETHFVILEHEAVFDTLRKLLIRLFESLDRRRLVVVYTASLEDQRRKTT